MGLVVYDCAVVPVGLGVVMGDSVIAKGRPDVVGRFGGLLATTGRPEAAVSVSDVSEDTGCDWINGRSSDSAETVSDPCSIAVRPPVASLAGVPSSPS